MHTSNVQLEPRGAGSSEELVLQPNDGGHGNVHLASGAAPTFWRISTASLVCIWSISATSLAYVWSITDASPVHLCRISGACPALW